VDALACVSLVMHLRRKPSGKGKGKGKFHPRTGHEGPEGE